MTNETTSTPEDAVPSPEGAEAVNPTPAKKAAAKKAPAKKAAAKKAAAKKAPAKKAAAKKTSAEAPVEETAEAAETDFTPSMEAEIEAALQAAVEAAIEAAAPEALVPTAEPVAAEATAEEAAIEAPAAETAATAEANAASADEPPVAANKNRRQDRPNRGKLIPISDEPVENLGFEDILAGALDQEEAADAPGFPKRVLPPQPELPKLHKVLAQAGLGSRLEMERLIAEGGITVNNQAAHVGQRIQWGDKVRIKGKLLRLNIAPPMPRVLVYHKPAGEVVTHDDPQNRPTVFRRLPRLQQGKWMSVGRLDLNTEGLLLFTSSGELANRMMHPSFGLEREYAARILGVLSEESRQQLLSGVELDDGPAQFGSVIHGGGEGANQWYRVTIGEGRNREVRRMFESQGHAVSRLIRIRYGDISLPRGLRRGFYMELGQNEVKALMEAAGMEIIDTRNQHFNRIDPKREQAKARGLRRSATHPKELPPDASFEGGPDEGPQNAPEYEGESRLRRTPYGRKRGGQNKAAPGAFGSGGGYNKGPRNFGNRGGGQQQPQQPGQRSGGGQRSQRAPRDDWDDDFSQRGVSHESPYESKASRKKVFSSNTQVPDIIRAQRPKTGGGGGGKGKGGGIDPLRTSLGFLNRR